MIDLAVSVTGKLLERSGAVVRHEQRGMETACLSSAVLVLAQAKSTPDAPVRPLLEKSVGVKSLKDHIIARCGS